MIIIHSGFHAQVILELASLVSLINQRYPTNLARFGLRLKNFSLSVMRSGRLVIRRGQYAASLCTPAEFAQLLQGSSLACMCR